MADQDERPDGGPNPHEAALKAMSNRELKKKFRESRSGDTTAC
ncbi:MAG TPA: hypothetical protein VG795_07725 [Acidimicrobiia bacterium]|nr:hypothetical protein [Acidimicrobiia bacterium]